jgi:putative membrane protein
MLTPVWKKNDRKASVLIITFSLIVFAIIISLSRIKIEAGRWFGDFDVHVFARANAIINSAVAVLLLTALIAVKNRKYKTHKKLMLSAMFLSILFLVSYICHHLLAGETKFGGEGAAKIFYYIILFTHIPLAGIILPFILFTAYRALIGEYPAHKRLARITWPVWFYVAVTGVIVYVLISPYY